MGANYTKNVITIIYTKNVDSPKIKLFGKKFVSKNKNKCFIIYDNKKYKLTEYFPKSAKIENSSINTITIKLIPKIKLTDLSYMFHNCTSLISLIDNSNINTSSVIDISYMFYNCNNLISITGLSKWNTSKIRQMNHMFFGCSSLKHPPFISGWDTSNVKNISYMFYKCSSLKIYQK